MKKLEPFEKERVTNMKELLLRSLSNNPDNVAYLIKDENNETKSISYAELMSDINNLGTGIFQGLSLEKGKVAIVAENSYDWITTFFAVACGNGIAIPIDSSLPEKELENSLRTANSPDVVDPNFTNNPDDYTLDAIVYDDSKHEVITNIVEKNNMAARLIPMSMLSDIKSAGKGLIADGETSYLDTEIDEEKFSFLFFTSATSATAKGVKMSHRGITSTVNHINSNLDLREGDRNVNILPCNHIYGTLMQLIILYPGATMSFSNLMYYQKDLQAVKPTILNFVPSLATAFRKKILAGLEKSGKSDLFNKIMYAENPSEQELAIKEQITKEVLSVFGGESRLVISSAGAMAEEDVRFYNALGMAVVEGYGLTETGIVTIGDVRVATPGHVGFPFDGFGPEIKLVDQNEHGEGEFVVSGESIMLGYYNNPEETEKVLVEIEEGKFELYTGDIGLLRTIEHPTYGSLPQYKIMGRKKNLIKIDGKNIYPEEIEEILVKNDLIGEVMITEENNRLIVVIVLNIATMTELDISKEQAEAILAENINTINEDLPDFKRITKVVLREEPFPKTTTRKIQRHLV